MSLNEQQRFWKEKYAKSYIAKNDEFDLTNGIKCWAQMLQRVETIESILECGCNVGRNINFLNHVRPEASKSIIEISADAYDISTSRYKLENSFNGTIVNSSFSPGQFDLVFTIGVLIHIHPDHLLGNMRKMYEYSSRYILIGEYFNRTPVSLEYQGEHDKLFKCDFGKIFMENFGVKLVDYGFLWGHLYDNAGFDDVTYWVFEKTPEKVVAG
jgi:pseudaminic acid biosynthesis-associated methylase